MSLLSNRVQDACAVTSPMSNCVQGACIMMSLLPTSACTQQPVTSPPAAHSNVPSAQCRGGNVLSPQCRGGKSCVMVDTDILSESSSVHSVASSACGPLPATATGPPSNSPRSLPPHHRAQYGRGLSPCPAPSHACPALPRARRLSPASRRAAMKASRASSSSPTSGTEITTARNQSVTSSGTSGPSPRQRAREHLVLMVCHLGNEQGGSYE